MSEITSKEKSWSSYQLAIFDAVVNGTESLAVNAVAGSGKTTTIIEAAKRLSGRQKAGAIFTAFNVKIRDEMASRLPESFEVANFHRIGRSILVNFTGHKFGGKTGCVKWKYNNIFQEMNGGRHVAETNYCTDASNLISKVMQTLSETDEESLRDLALEYDIAWDDRFTYQIPVALDTGIRQALDGVCINFDDMLFIPVWQDMPCQKYRLIFVDECQDLSPVQQALVLKLRDKDSRVIAVGDPRQAIYGFAGADVDSFATVKAVFKAQELPLSVCYRCPESHVEMAKQIVPAIEAASGAIKGTIQAMDYKTFLLSANPKSEDMVLSRTTAPLVRALFDLIKKRIPAQIAGGGEVMSGIVSLARKMYKLADEAWLNVPDEIEEYQVKEEERLKKAAVIQYTKLDLLIDRCSTLEFLHEEATKDGVDNVVQFEKWLEKFFDKEQNGMVTLSTIHRAKGLEADRVFIIDPDKTPHPMAKTTSAMEQEMNLKYVSLTRAKKELFLVEPKPSTRGLHTYE